MAAPAEGEEVRADAAAALLAGAGLGSLLHPEALARKRPRKQIPGLLAPKKRDPVSLTVQIVAAHVSNNAVQTTDLPSLIAEVHRALTGPVGVADGAPEPVRPPPVAASPTRRRAESAQKG
ncbi:MucR family transcriptional regulator [Roseomonas gilardii]|uniref:MucR family transcriptional regulator n=1 Tax=Roseomonas gilardii TaxID=257708 RepID=UPI001431266F|nr:MucR family transcriptional regulator [Roseomonas gilardii]